MEKDKELNKIVIAKDGGYHAHGACMCLILNKTNNAGEKQEKPDSGKGIIGKYDYDGMHQWNLTNQTRGPNFLGSSL